MEGEDKMNKQKPQRICALKTEQKEACFMEEPKREKTPKSPPSRMMETGTFEVKKLEWE